MTKILNHLDILSIVFILILIGLTAFFVAAEFAIVKVRSTRIDQLVLQGNKQAVAVKKVITHMDEYLSACQLGITVTALGIGWLGEPAIKGLIDPIFVYLNIDPTISSMISIAIAFFIITFLHVVVGELAPKNIAIQRSEAVALSLATPLIWFYRLLYPLIWLLNGSARVLVRILGMDPMSGHEESHTEEELRIIMQDSYKSGEINQSELTFVDNVFKFDDRIAKEVMVPRTEMVSLSANNTIADWHAVVQEAKYTRYPVYDGDKDNIIGFINVKDLLMEQIRDDHIRNQEVTSFLKPIITAMDSIPIHDLLVKMQKERIHIAILLDEYGGTSGLVTVEDIIEELVGEIRDEFDVDEVNEIVQHADGHYTFSGKVQIYEVDNLLEITLADEEVDTLGGWILSQNFEIKEEETIEYAGYLFTVIEMDGHQVLSVDVKRQERLADDVVEGEV